MMRKAALLQAIALASSLLINEAGASPTPILPDAPQDVRALRSDPGLAGADPAGSTTSSESQVWRATFPSTTSSPYPNLDLHPLDRQLQRNPKTASYSHGERILRAARKLDLDVWKSTREYIDVLFEDESRMSALLDEVEKEREADAETGSQNGLEGDVEVDISIMDISWDRLFTASDLHPHLEERLLPPPAPPSQPLNLSSLLSPFHAAYHPLEIPAVGDVPPTEPVIPSIYGFLDALQERWPDRCEVITLGKSAEGRDIKGVKVHISEDEEEEPSTGSGAIVNSYPLTNSRRNRLASWISTSLSPYIGNTLSTYLLPLPSTTSTRHSKKGRKGKGHKKGDKKQKPKRPEQPPPVPPNPNPPEARKGKELFLMGGQHAREWVSPATILYFAHFLLLESEDDAEIIKLLTEFTFTLVPTINPDGYVYSREHSRLWKKNRQDVGSKTCKGIDMNSNWGYQWDDDARSSINSNPCSENYPGETAFDAVETKVISGYLQNTTTNVRAFIDIHSYGQLFMFPYSYSCEDFPKDAETLMEAGLGVAKALKADSGTQYKVGEACDLVYRMAGDAIDWAYGRAGIRFSYSAELRDTGTYGFLLPPSLIRATAAELTTGLVYLAKFIRSNEAAA